MIWPLFHILTHKLLNCHLLALNDRIKINFLFFTLYLKSKNMLPNWLILVCSALSFFIFYKHSLYVSHVLMYQFSGVLLEFKVRKIDTHNSLHRLLLSLCIHFKQCSLSMGKGAGPVLLQIVSVFYALCIKWFSLLWVSVTRSHFCVKVCEHLRIAESEKVLLAAWKFSAEN